MAFSVEHMKWRWLAKTLNPKTPKPQSSASCMLVLMYFGLIVSYKRTNPSVSGKGPSVSKYLIISIPAKILTYKTTPKGPCAQIVSTLAPKHLYRDYFRPKSILFRHMGP